VCIVAVLDAWSPGWIFHAHAGLCPHSPVVLWDISIGLTFVRSSAVDSLFF
jgi:hypothetical protein